ncbi:MAG: Protein export cytoplasm protein SecA ATPase RNA helicase (TC 3.A.5.1.1) [uncultured Sulfurovum sp.]|uniref:Protein translocase subunit SecA n=1 Tax=uncultured Sulfurovum sp. TaxID=269237 RepID=A0A6S6T0P9_9BACT|nr:MAG: Protein export cytoplasm protein SecA ATPase RNA helicase (TC 3.A.5.1.1) [uncultured Sulfurovum sp.]
MLKILFGSKNDRIVKGYLKRAQKINKLEDKYKQLTNDELKNAFTALKDAVQANEKTLDDVLDASFAITREASTRVLGMRHHDVQLVGGMVLHNNSIAEMKTGEGKTLVATLAVVLNAMMGKGVHIVTVNDYLASRDSQEMGQLYNFLGYSVGCLTDEIHDEMLKKAQYDSDITYGTNNEYGFDYLRDNMKTRAEEKVQREHYFAIVDEVDSILIDEARTPLIISGPVQRDTVHYVQANKIALQMEKGEKAETKPGEAEQVTGDFYVDEKNKQVVMTEQGLQKAQDLFEVENLYSLENASLSHHLDQAMKAQYIFIEDIDYVSRNGEIIIVDEFTGRLSEGRRFSEGLHQAIEAKEGVEVKDESQTLAEITYQNYFRAYQKLAGMTGTAQTEATEFAEIYNLEVLSIPTNLPIARQDFNDLIYNTEKEKLDAVAKKVQALHTSGQPVLIGTASIEKSELVHQRLKAAKIPHNTLNAKNHENEAQIIMEAGKKGAVTVATNMAGRGVDIKVTDEIKELGGLYILGTERHESRRIDNQLRGRSGRQGDAGASQFYLSLDDNLLRIFGGDKIRNIMAKLGVEEGEYIDSKIVTRSVEKAQTKVENMHYESRKHVLEYDDIASEQRKAIYKFRNNLLDEDYDIDSKIKENRLEYVDHVLVEAEIYSGGAEEDFNLEKLTNILREQVNLDLDINTLKEKDYDDLHELILEILIDTYEAKMEALNEAQRSEVQRILYLQVLDPQWRDHLYEMDVMKTGIGLRGYNQKDPLTEYKKDSYNLFMGLVERIKYEAIKVLQVVQFNFEDPEEEQAKLNAMRDELEADLALAKTNSEPEVAEQTFEKKPKRNEPCPCGSGKKYKQCCGVSGPKKGLLA